MVILHECHQVVGRHNKQAWQVLAFAVLAHDSISPSKFLEQEYSDYFCLL
jgi:hypothetical protein